MTDVLPVIRVEPIFASRRQPRRAWAPALACVVGLVGASLLWVAHSHRGLVLANETPSEPPGLYVRVVRDPIRVGTIIAFMAPSAAFPYADRKAAYLHKTPILKAVAAIAGDRVCTLGGVLAVNGVRLAPIRQHDSQGFALPHWTACRRLVPGEVFVFSDRVPNSFDSRYYGPVNVASALVYRPLITTSGIGR